MNKVILMGRLTKVPELKQTPTGVSVLRFSLAVNRRFKNDKGEYDADFINCIAWRQTAEFIAKYFSKGSMVAIVGNIQTRSWDGKDGKKQYAVEVIADEAYFTGEPKKNTADNDGYMDGYSDNDFSDFDADPDDSPF